jgi:lipoprotein NlpD
MKMVCKSTRLFTLVLLAGAVLAGCASKGAPHKAPVEERTSTGTRTAPGAVEPAAPGKPLPGAENAGKPGYYTVKPGDTLIRIGLDAGQNWRDIVRWNSLENPNQIEVGQVLRVVPAHLAGVPATAETGVVTRPVTSATVSPVTAASAPPRPAASAAASAPSPVSAAPEEELAWVWPAAGGMLRGFDEVNNKGLDLGGKAGDPVLAAMDGRVVYAGAGLRGYGNLIILKHNNTYLSAYAHNQILLVKEDQSVHKGQKIAEMGSSDAERVALHFEIRRQGKPVDPAKYLPAR